MLNRPSPLSLHATPLDRGQTRRRNADSFRLFADYDRGTVVRPGPKTVPKTERR